MNIFRRCILFQVPSTFFRLLTYREATKPASWTRPTHDKIIGQGRRCRPEITYERLWSMTDFFHKILSAIVQPIRKNIRGVPKMISGYRNRWDEYPPKPKAVFLALYNLWTIFWTTSSTFWIVRGCSAFFVTLPRKRRTPKSGISRFGPPSAPRGYGRHSSCRPRRTSSPGLRAWNIWPRISGSKWRRSHTRACRLVPNAQWSIISKPSICIRLVISQQTLLK